MDFGPGGSGSVAGLLEFVSMAIFGLEVGRLSSVAAFKGVPRKRGAFFMSRPR